MASASQQRGCVSVLTGQTQNSQQLIRHWCPEGSAPPLRQDKETEERHLTICGLDPCRERGGERESMMERQTMGETAKKTRKDEIQMVRRG